MGFSRITETVNALNAAGIPAERGYPAREMQHVTGPVAAVCVESITSEQTKLAVYVCTTEGGPACENAAQQVMEILTDLGSQCAAESCSFHSKAGVFFCRVLAQWRQVPACTVVVRGKTLSYVTAVAVEKNVSRALVTDPQTGETAEECTDLGWSINIEELLPHAQMPEEDLEDAFAVNIHRTGGVEQYKDCLWVKIHLEDTPQGLRRVRIARTWDSRRVTMNA